MPTAEIIGFMREVDAHVGRLAAPRDRPRPVVLPSYGGARRQPNLTPLLALLLNRYGVPVLIHGVAGADPARACVTTAEILLELGIEPSASLADAQSRLDYDSVAYVPDAVLAPGLASFTERFARLIDPFGGDGYRVIGVAQADDLPPMRELLAAAHANALLLCGVEGEPVADPRRQPLIEKFENGARSTCADPETDAPAMPPRLPAAIDAATTAAWIDRALSGEEPVPDPIVTQLGCCLEGARR